MRRKPGLAFVSPFLPALTGGGSSMRAGIFLEAFSKVYDVSVVVPEVFPREDCGEDSEFLGVTCANVETVSSDRIRSADVGTADVSLVAQPRVSHIHVFKLITAPLIRRYMRMPSARRPFCTLDLDDHESRSSRKIAALAAGTGREAVSLAMSRWADFSEPMESGYLPLFDQVYVCHEDDRGRLQQDHPSARVHVVPNAVRVPRAGARPSDDLLTLLFVGNLRYYPNEDAVVWFCSEILPLIRTGTKVPFRVVIVGGHSSEAVQGLAANRDVTVTGQVADVDGFHLDSSISIVPIRAAGGTRIKILEAMSHGRPVVSTSVGAAGLDVHDGEQILLAETPSEFASACVALLHDAGRRHAIGLNGLNWVKQHHSSDAVEELIRTLCSIGMGQARESVLFENLDLFPIDFSRDPRECLL